LEGIVGNKKIGIVAFLLFAVNCSTTEPPQSNDQIKLELIDVSATEVFLQLSLIGLSNADVSIVRDEQLLLNIHMDNPDTCIIMNGLNPGTTYQFRAEFDSGTGLTNEFSTISVETLLPTNHNINWEKIDYNWTGLLADVAVIGNDNIWAVGDYFVEDSTEVVHYNGFHWDGKRWHFIKIPVKIWNTNSFSTQALEAIFATDKDNIWVTTGSQLIQYNGSEWGVWEFLFESLEDTLGRITNLWAKDNNEVWGSGRKGRLIKYSNSILQEFYIGTLSSVTDLWGSYSAITNERIIYCPIFNDSKLVVIDDKEEVKTLDINNVHPYSIVSAWSNKTNPIFAGGFEIFRNFNGRWEQEKYNGSVKLLKIRGENLNNIFAVGYDKIAHYNGQDWYIDETTLTTNSDVYGLDLKKNLIVIVGNNSIYPLLMIGHQ